MPATIHVIRARYRKRVFIQLDDGVALEVVLPISSQLADQQGVKKTLAKARHIAAAIDATDHIPTEFLEMGQVDFLDDNGRTFRFARWGLVQWCENLLWRFGITLIKPAGWENMKKPAPPSKKQKAFEMEDRDARGHFLKGNKNRWQDRRARKKAAKLQAQADQKDSAASEAM